MKRQLKLMLKIPSYRQWFSHSAFMFIWISEYMWWRLRFIFALSYLQKCGNYIIFEQFSSCNVSTWGHTPVATRPERVDLWAFLEKKKTFIKLIYALFNLDIRCLSFPAKVPWTWEWTVVPEQHPQEDILVLHTYIKQTVLNQIHITLNSFIETSCLELVSFAAGSTPS